MRNLATRQYYCDLIGFFSIGMFSLGYVVFGRPFAEAHIQLSFLNFPIFIGEILLAVCLGLFFLKGNLSFNKKSIVIISYFAFVIVKAVYGYSKFGPLAFRNAALFYYPSFIIFAYSFYRKEFIDKEKGIVLAVIMLFFSVNREFNTYWLLAFFIFIFILSYTCPRKSIKYLLLATLFLVTPYKSFFDTSRMMMVANFAAVVYLIAGLYSILKINKTIKVAIVVLGILLIAGMTLRFSDRNALLTLIRCDKIIEIFKDRDTVAKVLREKKIDMLERKLEFDQERAVQIYNPEPVLDDSHFNQDESVLSRSSSLGSNDSDANKLVEGTVDANKLVEGTVDANKKTQGLGLRYEGHSDQEIQSVGAEINHADSESNLDRVEMNKKTLSISWQKEILGDMGTEMKEENKTVEAPRRNIAAAYGNAVFRLFIWRDMMAEMIKEKPVLGFSFGKPLRSITLETLVWGSGDWERDGWIGAHNSFLHAFYRAGIVGLLAIGVLWTMFFKMTGTSISHKSLTGLLLCGIIVNWFTAANFLLILELPYTAIPIWSIFGVTLHYCNSLKRQANNENIGCS